MELNVSKLLTELTQDENGNAKVGALARIAEHVGVSKSVIVRWRGGGGTATLAQIAALDYIDRHGLDLKPRFTRCGGARR